MFSQEYSQFTREQARRDTETSAEMEGMKDIPGSRAEGWKKPPDELIGMRGGMPVGYSQTLIGNFQVAFCGERGLGSRPASVLLGEVQAWGPS